MVEWRYTQIPMTNLLRVIVMICAQTAGGMFVAQTKLPDSEVPIWSQELIPDLSRNRTGISPLVLDENRAGTAFLDDKQLIVYAVGHEGGELSSRQSPETSSPFRLNLSLVDAKSGKLVLAKSWRTRVHDSAVQVTTGGVLVKTGGIVRLYSSDFTQPRDLPVELNPNESIFTNVSASGKTIALSRIVRQKEHNGFASNLRVLDASSLKIRHSWNQLPPLYANFTISDEQIAIGYGSVIDVTEFEGEWRTILDNSKSHCRADTPVLVSNYQLVVRNCGDLLLWNPEQGFESLGLIDGRTSYRAVVAQGGQFVAVSFDTVEVNKHLLTEASSHVTATEIAIFNLNLKKRVLTVNVDPLPKNDYDFALSPDGSKLAVLNDRKVTIYAVQAQPAGQH